MPNIDSLSFEVLIDDAQFNQKIKEIQKAAQDLNANVSAILNLQQQIKITSNDDVTNAKNANKILVDNAKAQEKIAREAERTLALRKKEIAVTDSKIDRENAINRGKITQEVIRTRTQQERLNQLQERGNKSLSTTARLWRQVGSIATTYFSVLGASRLIKNLVQVSAEFELQRTTLGAILGDVQRANELYEQMKDLAVESPFAFKDLTSYAKQLSAFSVPANELYDVTKMLADVSAGLGVGMDRLILAYGQIRSAAFLRGQEVRQLTEAGVPILEELRKQFVALGEEGVTVGDVFDKISKRMVPFEMVEKVFKDMTSEGGKFYNMQEVQAETLKGKLSNLTDAYQIMFSEIGDKNSGSLKSAVDLARGLAENYEKVGRVIVSLVAAYGAYKAALIVTKVLEEAALLAGIRRTKQAQELSRAIKILTADSKAFAAAQKLITNPYALVAAGVVALGAYLISAEVQAEKFRKELEGIADTQLNTASKSVDEFNRLVGVLENATEGSQKYRNAIEELNRKYGEYLPNLLNEKNALNEIKRAQDEVTNAIYARARAYAESSGQQKIEDRYGDGLNKQVKALREMMAAGKLGEGIVEDIIIGFRDAVSKEAPGSNLYEFKKVLQDYLGESYGDFTTDVGTKWSELEQAANRYANTVKDMAKAERDYANTLEVRFGLGGYSSAAERLAIDPIKQKYAQEELRILNEKMSKEESDAAILENNLAKLHAIKQAYVDLNKEADTIGKNGAWNNKIKEVQAQIDALQPKENSWLQKVVNPLVNGEGVRDLKVQEADQYDEYIDKLRKEYKSVKENYADANSTYNKFTEDKKRGLAIDDAVLKKTKEQSEYLENRRNVIESIGKALGISLETSKKTSGGSTGKSDAQINLEMMRDTLKDIMSWYDKLKDAGMDDTMAQSYLKKFFPEQSDIIDAKSFREELLKVADALEKYDKKAAQSLRDDVSGNNINSILDSWKKAKKAEEDYKDLMDNWGEVFSFGGEGAEFNISKIIADYKKNIEKIMKQRRDVREALYAREDDVDYELEETKIDDNTFTSMRNALAKANEDVRKQAENWVKNWKGFEGIDLSRMSELTINELKNLRSQLNDFQGSPLGDFPEELRTQLEESGISIDTFADAVKKAIDELDKKTKEQERKAVVEKLKSYADGFKTAANGVKTLGEAIDNTDLTDFAEQMSDIADTAVKMAEAWADGNTAGVVITAASYVANAWLEAIAGAERFKATIQDLSLEMLELRYQSQLAAGTDTIFGENTYRSLKNASDVIGQLTNTMNRLRSKLDGITISTKKSKWWEFFLAPTASAAWGKLFTNKSFSVTEALRQMGADLMLENGKVNVDALQKLVDAYDGFSKAEREAMEDAISKAKEYNDALEQLNDAMNSLTGSVAGDFASTIVEQWKSAGNAAADYSEILDDLATKYAEMMIQNVLLEDVFNDDFKKQITDLTRAGKASEVLNLFDEKVKELENEYPAFLEILEGLDKYFVKDTEGNDASTLSNGIKGITEDTANLLASYVNAIRADVSYNKMQLQQILGLLPQSPTLADYLMQIQANTFNTAEHTRELMTDIKSMMTTSDGPALRVFM